ncbi:hypothetical protein LY76DRAFT_70048 [Colletotrichum caudatum]|nr:hypothetical protein LY76DRAFT_70048 [Colletotrichum caudatum]
MITGASRSTLMAGGELQLVSVIDSSSKTPSESRTPSRTKLDRRRRSRHWQSSPPGFWPRTDSLAHITSMIRDSLDSQYSSRPQRSRSLLWDEDIFWLAQVTGVERRYNV